MIEAAGCCSWTKLHCKNDVFSVSVSTCSVRADCDAAAVWTEKHLPLTMSAEGGVGGRGVGTMRPVLPRCGLHCTSELRGVSTSCWEKPAPSTTCWSPLRPVQTEQRHLNIYIDIYMYNMISFSCLLHILSYFFMSDVLNNDPSLIIINYKNNINILQCCWNI